MNLEKRLKNIEIALKMAEWFSADAQVDYNLELSLGILFVEGKIIFFNETILEFTESITPERMKYRYHYMRADGVLIFRYDNMPHHPEIATFPDHKHEHDEIRESEAPGLKQVIEEIINDLTRS